jgi:Uma2 family endonuclease
MSATIKAPEPATTANRKRWTIAEFDRLVRDGILREGGPEFLWDGEILQAMSENPPHFNAVSRLADLLRSRLSAPGSVVYQGIPIVLREGYKPQPDLTVVRGPRSRFQDRTPTPADVALLVEVSDTTYADDSGPYLRAYAAAAIPTYWVVNLAARRVEVYTRPEIAADGSGTYRDHADFGLGQAVPLEGATDAIPVVEILTDAIEPPAVGA